MTEYAEFCLEVGADLVSIGRIRRLLDEYPSHFREFGFTADEQQYCDSQSHPAQHYAGRWAVKEAFIKAIGERGAAPDLSSIEVLRDPSPRLSLAGDGRDLLKRVAGEFESSVEDTSISVSIAHEQQANVAFGVVIILI